MTARSRSMMFLVALGALLLVLAGPAVATAEDEAPAPAPTEVPTDVPAPAVSIAEEEESAATPEWTFRFLLPATLLIGAVVVIGTIIAYFAKVTRQRYRVVE